MLAEESPPWKSPATRSSTSGSPRQEALAFCRAHRRELEASLEDEQQLEKSLGEAPKCSPGSKRQRRGDPG